MLIHCVLRCHDFSLHIYMVVWSYIFNKTLLVWSDLYFIITHTEKVLLNISLNCILCWHEYSLHNYVVIWSCIFNKSVFNFVILIIMVFCIMCSLLLINFVLVCVFCCYDCSLHIHMAFSSYIFNKICLTWCFWSIWLFIWAWKVFSKLQCGQQ